MDSVTDYPLLVCRISFPALRDVGANRVRSTARALVAHPRRLRLAEINAA
jgi:hypothetical protein